MRLHLPCSLRKSLLSSLVSMVALSLGSDSACAVTEPEPQNLVFDGATLTWNTDTENKVFTNAAGESASFAPGDNVTFASDATASLGEDISAGQINIANGADVVIELADNGLNFDTLSMLGGSLDAGDSLNIAAGETLAVGSNGSVLKSDLVLEKNASLSVDYAGTGSATSLDKSVLSLQGGTRLQLSGCGNGDGKTYTLLAGISELKDAQGNTISLGEGNNAISSYFDTSQPGTGFWANGTLVLNDGTLQLVLHDQEVKEAATITTRRTSGADYQYYAGVCFKNIEYSSSSSAYGGAIYGFSSSTITLSNNGSVMFSGNTASGSSSAYGGAIYGYDITLSNNESVTFSGNTASGSSSSYGGAITSSTITLSNNGSVMFSGNTASGSGGAIYGSSSSTITLSNNGSVTFSGNTASGRYASGGAIYGFVDSTITLSNNGSVEFSGNTVSGPGGAIYGIGDITLSNNGSVMFSGNTASGSGGAIFGGYGSMITLSNNGSVTFSRNTVSGVYTHGGAIYVDSHGKLILEGNDSIVFEDNNSANSGGALYLYHVEAEAKIVNNGSVLFSRNSARSGGAIGISNDSPLIIANNDDVIFEKNAEIKAGEYRLRSIYAIGASSVSLSAAAGKSITFRDSIYIGRGNAFKLNDAYEGIAQQGDIIFTGESTVDDLYSTKDNVAGTAEEIQLSRTTEINTLTELYGGRLRVEEGAIYKGCGITATAGSEATVRVKDAVLNHTGYELHFFEGTKLEALGASEIFGDVIVESTATAAFSALTRLEGSLTLVSGSELCLAGELTLDGALRLGTRLTLSGDMLEMVNQLQAGQSLTLMVGLDSMAVLSSNLLKSDVYTDVMSGQILQASHYFSNLGADSGLVLMYDGAVGSLSMSKGYVIPEPTTATLSLLALTALMSRRRRK